MPPEACCRRIKTQVNWQILYSLIGALVQKDIEFIEKFLNSENVLTHTVIDPETNHITIRWTYDGTGLQYSSDWFSVIKSDGEDGWSVVYTHTENIHR